MIKRLKWNVLYGSDNDRRAGDSDSSDSEADYEQASLLLSQLAKNDPELQNLHQEFSEEESEGDEFLRDEYSESDGEEEVVGFDELAIVVANRNSKKQLSTRTNSDSEESSAGREIESGADEDEMNDALSEEEEQENFIEWRECNLCPGKRFLNDKEVETHVLSKGHSRALKRYEKQQKEEQAGTEKKPCHSNAAQDVDAVAASVAHARAENLSRSQEMEKRTKAMGQVRGRQDVHTSGPRRESKVVLSGKDQGQSSVQNKARRADAQGVAADPDLAKRKKLAAKEKLKRLKARKWKRKQEQLKSESLSVEKAAMRTELEDPNALVVPKRAPLKTSIAEVVGGQKKKVGKHARAMNRKAADAMSRAPVESVTAPHQSADTTTKKKGPKMKSKKPMSAEKAARKALNRHSSKNSESANSGERKRPLVAENLPSAGRKRVKANRVSAI